MLKWTAHDLEFIDETVSGGIRRTPIRRLSSLKLKSKIQAVNKCSVLPEDGMLLGSTLSWH